MTNRMLYLAEHLDYDAQGRVSEVRDKMLETLTPKWSNDPAVLTQQQEIYKSLTRRVEMWSSGVRSFAVVFDPSTQSVSEVKEWTVDAYFDGISEMLSSRIRFFFGAVGVNGVGFSLGDNSKHVNGRTIWCNSHNTDDALAARDEVKKLADSVGKLYVADFAAKATAFADSNKPKS